MPHREGGRGLKRNLALPGESNRLNVQGGIGQIQDQASPIVSEKALEQPVVKPGGVPGRTTKRRTAPTGAIAPKPTGLAQATITDIGKTITPSVSLGPRGIKKTEPRQIGTSVLTKEGGVDVLRGTRPPVTKEIDFTRGTAKEVAIAKKAQARALAKTGRGRGVRRGKRSPFDISTFKGIENIVTSAGELAAGFASPKFQTQLSEARGIKARRKGKRADVKLVNERIKALSSTLSNVPDLEGNEEIRNTLTTQITDLISKGSTGTGDAVLNDATRFKKAGFSNEEVTSILGRLGAVNAA